jgi:transcriptional regulator with XRE-family HTH domain
VIHTPLLTQTERPEPVDAGLAQALPNRSKSLRHDCQAMGARLRHVRQERGLTLGDVARALRVTPACVCQWEAGKSYPKPHFWPELSRAVGSTVSYLITGEEVIAPALGRVPEDIIERARGEIARVLGLDPSSIRIEVDRP